MSDRAYVPDEREELPCIWALAGVLSYRPCDRGYECEACELFHALSRQRPSAGRDTMGGGGSRGRVGEPGDLLEDDIGAHVSDLLKNCRLYLDRWYSPRHYWLSFGPGTEVVLGLHAYIPRILYPIDEISTPAVGAYLGRGTPSGWIARATVAVPMTMPLAGRVKSVNEPYVEALKANSALPAEADWLLRVDAAQPLELEGPLYRGDQMLRWYLTVIRTLKEYLQEAVAGTTEPIGLTLADGGVPDRNLEHVLGRERFIRLVNEML